MNPPDTEAGKRMPRTARLPRGKKGTPSLHSPRVASGLGKNIFPPHHPKRCTRVYVPYKAHVMEIKEWLWPWHILSLNRTDGAFSGMLDLIICTQATSSHSLGDPTGLICLG